MTMWLLHMVVGHLPTGFWLLLSGAGIAGFFAAGVLAHFPPLKAYTLFIKPVCALAAGIGIFMYGGASIDDYYQTMIHELEEKVKIAEAKSQTVNTVIEERVKLQKQVIKDTQLVYQDRIVEVATQIDRECKLDPVVPKLHNDAATNPVKPEETKK